jgi:hypothetical protein
LKSWIRALRGFLLKNPQATLGLLHTGAVVINASSFKGEPSISQSVRLNLSRRHRASAHLQRAKLPAKGRTVRVVVNRYNPVTKLNLFGFWRSAWRPNRLRLCANFH